MGSNHIQNTQLTSQLYLYSTNIYAPQMARPYKFDWPKLSNAWTPTEMGLWLEVDLLVAHNVTAIALTKNYAVYTSLLEVHFSMDRIKWSNFTMVSSSFKFTFSINHTLKGYDLFPLLFDRILNFQQQQLQQLLRDSIMGQSQHGSFD